MSLSNESLAISDFVLNMFLIVAETNEYVLKTLA